MTMLHDGKQCSYECRDMGFDCDWYCIEDDENVLIDKVKAHAAEAHGIKNPATDKISGKIRKPANPDLK
ncbi:MAG: DUF1059 domain-containing protein [Chloroflexi bacterium]|nr:DUF1059 domain-containing protein [Chloroflexota bacterium]MBT7080250.1 DUF1059 domain-containing protein [Chloroflexota bacterium]MBT7289330.1 DUF1059 domain-containing protein [Chloroflexota bacterium]